MGIFSNKPKKKKMKSPLTKNNGLPRNRGLDGTMFGPFRQPSRMR